MRVKLLARDVLHGPAGHQMQSGRDDSCSMTVTEQRHGGFCGQGLDQTGQVEAVSAGATSEDGEVDVDEW